MILIHLGTVRDTKTIFFGLIARLLEQIRIPQRDNSMSIKLPGRKHAGRQIIRPAGNGDKYRFGIRDGNQLKVAIEKIFQGKMIDLRGASVVSGAAGIDSHSGRSAEAEI